MSTIRSIIALARPASAALILASVLAGCGDDPATPDAALDAGGTDVQALPDLPVIPDVVDAGARDAGFDVPDVRDVNTPEVSLDAQDATDVATGDGGVPAIIAVPAGNTELFRAAARGVQIYTCTAPAADAGADGGTGYSWVFRAPEATLYDGASNLIGQHFVGPNWRAVDGSQVTGAAVHNVASPTAGAIPWLLLSATAHAGSGVFTNVSFVQRLNTVGGVAPATGCDATTVGTEQRVTYTADYAFWAPTMDAAAPALPLPASLDLPTTGRSVLLRAAAEGVQIYRCTAAAPADGGVADAGAPYQWVFTAPEATLYDAAHAVIGTHSAGPRWRGNDGSEVVGTVVARNNAPVATAIPWLLLSGAPTSAAGIFSHARFVHRVATAGGVAPSTGCDASTVGTDARVDYTADYYFWGE
jgi:hypothetical protein